MSHSLDIAEISRDSGDYPARLRRISDAPKRLFVAGMIPDGPAVGIVGTRKPDPWAVRWTQALARELVARGVTVVSGGAMGIDAQAHRGALDGGGATVAVLGSGMDHMAPPSNRGLFHELIGSGALVTEYEDSVRPSKWSYPRRNRIVAALSDAVIVVQAAEGSGSLITAKLARKYDIPLGAVPGNAGDPKSRGCNELLRQGVSLVENVEDVLRLMSSGPAPTQLSLPTLTERSSAKPQLPTDLAGDEQRVFDLLEDGTMHIDDIVVATGMEVAKLSAAIVSLEISGWIEDRGSKCFARAIA